MHKNPRNMLLKMLLYATKYANEIESKTFYLKLWKNKF